MENETHTSKLFNWKIVAGAFFIAVGFIGLFDDLGLGWLNYYISDIVQNIIDYVVYIFIVVILFSLFTAPAWVKKLVTWGSD